MRTLEELHPLVQRSADNPEIMRLYREAVGWRPGASNCGNWCNHWICAKHRSHRHPSRRGSDNGWTDEDGRAPGKTQRGQHQRLL